MSDVKNKSVKIYIDQSSAQAALESLQRAADKLNKKIEEGRVAGKNMASSIAQLEVTKNNIKNVQEQIDKGLRPTFAQVTANVTKLRNELRRMSEDAPGYAEKFKAFQAARTELDRMKQSLDGVDKAQRNWMQEAKTVAFGVLIGNTVQSAIGAISSYLGGIVTGNAKMSDSLAKVRQTTGLTAAEVASLSKELKGIDTRTAQSDLLKIAEIGGQFNVPKEQLKGFVEQIDKANVVLGGEFGGGAEQITTELALLRNVFTDIKSDRIDVDLGNIGNAMITLAQEGAATAPVISDFSKRLSPLIATAKLTSGEILGLGATMQELAINPERGGTALVKLFDKMISNADAFAKVAGVGVDEFRKQLQNNPFEAFLKVLEGFKKGGNDVVALNTTIADLETQGVGAKEALVKLSQNIDLVKDRSKLATDALTKQDKITEQFAVNNNTLGAELDKLNKKISAIITSNSLSQFFAASVRALSGFIDVLKAVPNFIANNNTAISLLIVGLVTMNASYIKSAVVISQNTAAKIYNATITRLTAIATNIAIAAQSAYIVVTNLLTGRITLATAAQRLWNISMTIGAGPIGVLITLIGVAALAVAAFTDKTKGLTAAQKLNTEIQNKVYESTYQQVNSLQLLTKVAGDNTVSLENRKKALAEIIAISPEYLKGLTLENINTAEGKRILDGYISSLKQKAEIEAKSSLLTDKLKERDDTFMKIRAAGIQMTDEELTKALSDPISVMKKGGKAYNDFIQGLRKAGIELNDDGKKISDNLNQIKLLQFDIEKVARQDISKIVNTQKVDDKVTATAGLIDTLRQKIKLLDDALGGLTTKDAIDKNRAERAKLQAELDALEGKKSSKKEDNSRNKLLQELADFKAELERVGKTADENEIARITQKYDKLIKEAQSYGLSILDVEQEKNRAIAFLEKQTWDKIREEARVSAEKDIEDDFKRSMSGAEEIAVGEKEAAKRKYADSKISKLQYDEEIKQADLKMLDFQIALAESFVGVSKQASGKLIELNKKKNALILDDDVQTKERKEAIAKAEALAGARVKVLKSQPGSESRRQAMLEELELQKQQALKELELSTTNEEEIKNRKELINEEYRQKQAELTLNFYAEQINQVLNYISTGLDVLSKFNDARNAKEKAALDKELKGNEARKASIKKLQDQRVISANEAARRIAVIEREEEARKEQLEKKQQERGKRIAITQAIINGAMAITSTLAAKPGPADIFSLGVTRAIQIALAVATTAAQIATISAQKFAFGGKVSHPGNGRINVARNIPTQPNGDDVLATVKVGEVILNEQQQAMLGGADTFRRIGVPGFATGGAVTPFWKNRPYQTVNVPRIMESIQVVKFAEGGKVVLPKDVGSGAVSAASDPVVVAALQQSNVVNAAMMETIKGLTNQLAQGISADVSLKKIEDANLKKSRIKNDAELK